MFRLGLYVGGGTSPAPTETCGNDNCQIQEVSPSGKALSIAMSGINVKTGDVGTSSSVWKRTGAACSAQGEIVTPTAQELSANGNTVKPGPGAQCGFFNGEYYCAGASPPPAGGCVTTAGGQAFCTSAAASPPAPKNPATGVKAAPDSTLAVRDGGNTTTIEHFSAVTVSNSGGASGGTAGGATGGTSSGSTGGSTSGGSTGGTSGGITGGGDCVIEPACDGGDAVQCFIAKQSWRDACNAGQSVTGGTTCDAPPVCTGDPVGCYQAEAAWHTACAANIPTQAQATDAINQGFGVSEITEGSLLPVHSTVDGAGWFSDAMATAGGGMCLPDIHINLPQVNADVTIPLEHACSIVKLLRALVLISAAFVAFRIYMDGFN